MNETILKQNKEYNLKLYPIYKAISWDLLFYYAICFLFLSQIKGFSASEIIFIDAFYPIFKFIFIIPCNLLINKLGDKKSLIIGNYMVAFNMLIFILSKSIPLFILSNFFSAVGFNLKNITEGNILYSSIPKTEHRNSKYSKIEGNGASYYFYIDAITALFTGFLFLINGYLPMILCFILTIFSIFLSYKFKEANPINTNKSSVLKSELSSIRQGFKFIFKSNRLRHLILFAAVFNGILATIINLRSSIFTDINLPSQYFGIFYAVLQIISGITSANSLWFHNRYKNNTLKKLVMPFCISMIIIGICTLETFYINYIVCIIILLIMFIIQAISKGPYQTLIKTYLNSFASHSMRTKITSAFDFCYGIVRTIISFICSALLGIVSTSYVFVLLGCLLTAFFVILLDKMKYTVGLNPTQYNKKDIEFTEVH